MKDPFEFLRSILPKPIFEEAAAIRLSRELRDRSGVAAVTSLSRQIEHVLGLATPTAGMIAALEQQRGLTAIVRGLEGSMLSPMSPAYAALIDRAGGFAGAVRGAALFEKINGGRSLGTARPAWFEDLHRSVGGNRVSAQLLRNATHFADLSRAFAGPVAAVNLWGNLAQEVDHLAGVRSYVRALDALQRPRGGAFRKRVDGYDELGVLHDPSAADLEDPETVDRLNLPDDAQSTLLRVEFFPLQLAADFLRDPRLMQSMPWRRFEELVAEIFFRNGARDVVLMPGTKDGGKDIVARVVRNGVPVICYIQCKRYAASRKIEIETVRALMGTVREDGSEAQHGALVTTSQFTRDSRKYIAAQSALEGHDLDGVTALLRAAYPSLT